MTKKIIALSLFTLLLIGCAPKKHDDNAGAAGANKTGTALSNVAMVTSVQAPGATGTPDFSWNDQSGSSVLFSDISRGKPVLLNFWATWCGPCVKEMPDLVELSKEYEAKGALVIGISLDKDSDVMKLVAEFAKDKQVTYPLIVDNGELEKAFGGIRAIPTTFYIDKNGKIVEKLIGMQSKARFAQGLDALL
ncbi:MAG: TlpA family protein disulfide reductase [Bacteroidota bacterium]